MPYQPPGLSTPQAGPTPTLSKGLILAGVVAALLGLLLAYSPGALRTLSGWFGRLPGDIRCQSGGTPVVVPWVSMLVVSAVLNLLLRLLR